MTIGVIGAGAWGTTLATLFSKNDDVILYVRNIEQARAINEDRVNEKYMPGFNLDKKITISSNKQDFASLDFIVFAVPSTSFRSILKEFSFVDKSIPFVSVTKGLEKDTHMRMTEVILDVHKDKTKNDIAVIAGPNLAIEIMQDRPAATVVASENKELATKIQKKLVSKNFRVYTSNDVIGCEIAGVAKNVIAIAVGIGDGAGYGANAKALVITRGLAEITRLGIAIGGKPETFAGLAGVGDLIATCSSPLSRNRTAGFLLGTGKRLNEILSESNHVAEGVNSVKSLNEYAKENNVSMPIVDAIDEVVRLGQVTPEAVGKLMARPATSE